MIPERRRWRRSGIFIVNFEHVIAGWIMLLITNRQCEHLILDFSVYG